MTGNNHHCPECSEKVDEMLLAETEKRWDDNARIAREIHAHLCFGAPYPQKKAGTQ